MGAVEDVEAAHLLQASAEAGASDAAMGSVEDGEGPPRLRRQSAGARMLRAELVAVPPPAPPPAVGFPGGIITCTVCQQVFRNGAPGFMRHLATIHAGHAVDGPLLALLRGLHRAACSDSACGGFRRVGMAQCNLCRRSTAARPIHEGDLVPGPRSVDPAEAARERAQRLTERLREKEVA